MQIQSEILTKLKSLNEPAIIAISGFGGSGKSSIAKQLGNELSIPVIGVDSFQKDEAFDTEYKLWEIMDFSRLETEVLVPFINKELIIKYGHFDPGIKSISKYYEVKNIGKLIIEGVGLFRPELMKHFSYKVWIDCPIEVAIARGQRRDREEYGNPTDALWTGLWKENDLQYLEQLKPREKADMIIDNP